MNATRFRRVVATMTTIAAGISIGLLLTAATARASATVKQSEVANAPTIAACKTLPLNQREFCMSQVSWAAMGGANVTTDPAASAKTKAEMAACGNLPTMTHFICQDQAGYGQAVPRQTLPKSQDIALTKVIERYDAAVAACNQRPISMVNTYVCTALAGQDTRLTAARPASPTG